MKDGKYVLINELTEEILKMSDSLPELQKAASKLSSLKKGKKPTLLIKESATDEIVQQYGLLLD